ncbi:hypothetical protein [Sphingomonas aquatilis]
MCIDPNAEPVAFALDTKLCHLLPTLTEPHREAIAQDLARTAIFMATAMAADMAQDAVNGLVPIPKMPTLGKPPAPALVPQAQTPHDTVLLTPAVAPVVTIKAKTTDVTVAGFDQRQGYTFGIDNTSDRLIDIRHAGKCWCIDPSDEATDVVSRAIGALAAAHADIGTALTDKIGR